MKKALMLAAVVAIAATATAVALAANDKNGFKTEHPSMLTGVATGSTAEPIITVGDTLPGGYRFESIPDGIALKARGNGRLDVYVNHETSTVPFPYNAGAAPEANQNDFDNAQLSRLALSQKSGGVLNAKMVIESSSNYQRFCSSYLATAAEGFDRELLFMNEEATDFVYRTGTAWPAPASEPPAEQAGLVVAYDVRTGKHKPIYGMGRHNHENSVAIPGFDDLVVLSGDDTFTPDPAQSQLYSYIAPDADAIWDDTGRLYGFRVDNAAVNDYYDVPVGSTASYPGTFVPIGSAAAKGTQTALETASDAAGVFQFVRVEDIAYDKRPGKANIVYIADSGRGSDSAGTNAFASRNGRIWKLEFTDPDDPTKATLSLLIEGDDQPIKTVAEIHQPDNLETTAAGSLMVTGGSGLGPAVPGRVDRYESDDRALVVGRPRHRRDDGGGKGRPVGRRGVDRRGRGGRRQPRGLGVQRRRRRIGGLRRRRLLRHDPGEHALAREGDRRSRRRPRSAQARLHEEACRRAARAAPRAGRLATERTRVGQASGPGPPSSSTTKPGPPANRQWSMFMTRPSP